MVMMRLESTRTAWRSRIRLPLLAAIAMAGVFACKGDTLYDAGATDVPPPVVVIERPVSGAPVQAGRPIAVRITARDTLGVATIRLNYSGVATGVVDFEFVPPRQTVTVDTVIVVPAGIVGKLQVQASSTNGRGARGASEPVSVNVSGVDEIAPLVSMTATVPARVELTDSIRVRVIARDNDGGSGLLRLGFAALVTVEGRTDTLVVEGNVTLPSPQSATLAQDFAFVPPFVTDRDVPINLTFSFFGLAWDAEGNCASSTDTQAASASCTTFTNATGEHTIGQAVPSPAITTAVAGRSIALPSGSTIADAAPDVSRQRLYLSNFGQNRLEVLNLNSLTFTSPVTVGSQPWGVAMNGSGDTLFVANSGGTNVSVVSLNGTPAEAVSRRIRTPNAVLFTVERQNDINNVQVLQVRFTDFSDRPQFIAQDAFGRLLYSTLPTTAAPDGTIRVSENQVGWQQPEVRLLLGRGVFEADSTNISILNVDSMRVFSTPGASDRIQIYDHRNGFPATIVSSGLLPLDSAIAVLIANPDSDIEWAPGRFVTELVGLRDTTFVAASGDRHKVAFGEGAVDDGRIIVWDANTASISNEITVADLTNNASEHILGLSLNEDGSLGAARGSEAAYFFNNDLRLQGRYEAPVTTGGGSGATLHPLHPSYSPFPPPGPNTLAFVADGTNVRIVDTVSFSSRGSIAIRDNVIGPLRVSRPLPAEAACSGPDCIVAKLYGVTSASAVVILNVRARDIS
jgi:hypothetical protein